MIGSERVLVQKNQAIDPQYKLMSYNSNYFLVISFYLNYVSSLLQLDKIAISFDGGKTTMNFAEAALLIQGSACVYSKKVSSAGNE